MYNDRETAMPANNPALVNDSVHHINLNVTDIKKPVIDLANFPGPLVEKEGLGLLEEYRKLLAIDPLEAGNLKALKEKRHQLEQELKRVLTPENYDFLMRHH